MSPPVDVGRRVLVRHAKGFEATPGTIMGVATQAGMDFVVEFDNGQLAEFRTWEVAFIPE